MMLTEISLQLANLATAEAKIAEEIPKLKDSLRSTDRDGLVLEVTCQRSGTWVSFFFRDVSHEDEMEALTSMAQVLSPGLDGHAFWEQHAWKLDV